ncbi:probable transporter Seo1p [[Candida] railenensis]|uniref:Probable transporter Seo1p n=1 Tax=[Candida] railenensis TaxID=45579 RepID=A0A9P0QQ09_9ASCO|nr:probable transporter Seo1p [[Candida] railenensis]
MKLPKWLPQERVIEETEEEIQSALLYLKDEKGEFHIKEYRDEVNRPWWKFFDEYEYRKNVPRWSWFGEGASAAERKLLLKLDAHIVIYCMMGYWCKFFDASNLTNAYVSGMKEDVGMKGNDLIDAQVMLAVGNVIFCLPIMYVLPRFPTTYLLFFNEFLWSLCTLLTFTVPNAQALKAVRFFLGGFETAYFPIVHYTLSNFYKPSEISSRASIFYCGQYLGILTSGLLQSSIYEHLNGVNGLAGWKWMFIIDGIISFVVAIIGLFLMPGTPFKCYSLWLTDDDIKLCRRRMRSNGTDDGLKLKKFLDWDTWKQMLTSWHFWILSLGGIGGFNANATSQGQFALWLKSLKQYSIPKINNYTAIPPALGLAYVIITCFAADISQKRFAMIGFAQSMNLVSCVILAVWDVPKAAKWFAYYWGYWSWSQSSVFYPLVNDILRHDANLKSIEFTFNYILGLQSYAWISKLIWETVDSPRFQKGFITAAAMGMLEAFCMFIGYYFYKRDERKRALSQGIYLYNSGNGELPPNVLTESVLGSDKQSYDDRLKLEVKTEINSIQDQNSA